ncbi:NAD(P)H-binding protein [Flavobacterium sp. Sd200]|uniref:NmrA family NAD(P)-binding protein n=1 Tax=Flavobacterium sp. Sd200 TaxID=2692211 RepID=UPI00136A81EB|nr:NAD(P)H-binding protein [Flavobacterium sp. Sd200]MXN91179.1 NAD(P)H-binding protein [Flavobacterium sp. Sd200]
MKIIITGSLGNIGKPLTQKLIAKSHEVTVVSSQEDRKAAINALGAKAAVGSVSDTEFLTNIFADADALFAMTPPNLGGSNVIANTVGAGKAFANAIKQSGIKRVVLLSSIGADLPSGNGPIKGLYEIEQLYNDIQDVSFTYLRAGYFYNNFYNDIPLIKNAGITGANIPANATIPLVHTVDIATAAAEELTQTTAKNNIRYIVSDVKTPTQVAAALGTAIGKPELPWVEFSNEEYLGGMTQAGVPEEIAALYTEMGAGLANGSIANDFIKSGAPVVGQTKLEEFAKEFAATF